MRLIVPTLLVALTATLSNAAPISYNNLSSDTDGSTEVIIDTLNDREWLRWDVLADLTYAQTQAAIAAGGAYEGWTISTAVDAQLFIDALLPGNLCTVSASAYCSDGVIADFDWSGLTGDNFGNLATHAWFLGIGTDVGYIQLNDFISVPSSSHIVKFPNAYSFGDSDQYSASGTYHSATVSWLLYRDVPAVPLPASGLLMVAGLGALAARWRLART